MAKSKQPAASAKKKRKLNDVIARSSLIKLAKDIPQPSWEETTPELDEARKAYDDRKKELNSDPLLKKLGAKVDKLDKANDARKEAIRTRRRRLIQRAQIDPITPALVREIREMLGLL